MAALAPAHARADGEVRVAMLPFEGPASARARRAALAACWKDPRIELVDDERVEETAQQLDADLATDAGRAAVARELTISSLVDGGVRKRGRQLQLVVRIYRGSTGELTSEITIRARGGARLATQTRRRMASELRKLEVEPFESEVEEPEPEPVAALAPADEPAAKPEPPSPEVEPEPESRELTALELSLDLGVVARDFTYQDASADLSDHTLPPTPALRSELRWYPGAHATTDFAAHLGLELHGELMLPIDLTQSVSIYVAEHYALGGAGRARIPIGPSELGIHAGGCFSSFIIHDSQFGGDPEIPSVEYRFARFGADGRIALGADLQVDLGAAYLLTVGYGEVAGERWFPHTTGAGIEGELGVSYALSRALRLELALGLTAWFMSFHTDPNDQSVIVRSRLAGGATDQHLRAGAGAALRL